MFFLKKGQLEKKISGQNSIEVINVSKIFKIPHERRRSLKSLVVNLFKKNRHTVLNVADDVSFEVKKGEFFGIIGRNGSGKSTMLKMLAGIYMPNKGKIKINGRLSPFLELGVGFNPELTAHDNVYLNGTILGLSKKEIEERFDEIIAFAELEEFVDQKLKNFSSGMQVRLAFSVAIQAHAEIILIDEVLAVGDYNFQQKCFEKFRELKKDGKTVIFVSHSMGNIEEFCDRVLLLDKGKVNYIGSPKEAVSRYNMLNISVESKNHNKNARMSIKDLKFRNSSGERSRRIYVGDSIVGRGKIDYGANKNVSRGHLLLGVGVYDEKDNLILADSIRMVDEVFDNNHFNFNIKIPEIKSGIYKLAISVRDLVSDEVYLENFKAYQFFVVNKVKTPAILSARSFWHPDDVNIVGITRIRNEELIIKDTLDHIGKTADKIIVLNDASTDKTLEIVYNHPKVIEVINYKTWKKNREVEETEHRQVLLDAAQKYNPKWIFYFDADERFVGDIRKYLLSKEAANVDGIRISLFDSYLTSRDKKPFTGGKLLDYREFYGPERRDILMIWANKPNVEFRGVDAREPIVTGNIITKFLSQHYGKSLSINQWEDTCDYYSQNFPMYSEKWQKRKGKAIHDKSDFGRPLYTWGEVVKHSIVIHPKK